MLDYSGHPLHWTAAAQRITGFPASRGAVPALPAFLIGLDGPARKRARSEGAFRTEARLANGNWVALLLTPSQSEFLLRIDELPAGEATAEQELERTRTALEASHGFQAFTLAVSHELRAPLRTIAGFADILLRDYSHSLPAPARAHLDRIARAGAGLAQSLDALAQFSKLGAVELRHHAVDLSKIAWDVAADLAANEPARRVDLSVQPALSARGDARLLRLVLENLLGNSWKFTARRARARIEFGRDARTEAFFVRDNGAGFDMAYYDRLFLPFSRLHSEIEFGGTGVGLATVERIVRRHLGRVWAESEPGKGATFFFSIEAQTSTEVTESNTRVA